MAGLPPDIYNVSEGLLTLCLLPHIVFFSSFSRRKLLEAVPLRALLLPPSASTGAFDPSRIPKRFNLCFKKMLRYTCEKCAPVRAGAHLSFPGALQESCFSEFLVGGPCGAPAFAPVAFQRMLFQSQGMPEDFPKWPTRGFEGLAGFFF